MKNLPLLLFGIAFATHPSDCQFRMGLNEPDGFSTLVIEVRTEGTPTDEDGYVVSVRRDGVVLVESIRLRAEESEQFQLEGAAAGVDVLLEDIAAHCRVSGDNPRRTSSSAGTRAAVAFDIRCGAKS